MTNVNDAPPQLRAAPDLTMRGIPGFLPSGQIFGEGEMIEGRRGVYAVPRGGSVHFVRGFVGRAGEVWLG